MLIKIILIQIYKIDIHLAPMRLLLGLMEAILLLCGAVSEEELDESTVERFERYAHTPLHLNTAGRSALLESGLLSEYQAAVLMAHLERAGAVRSYVELALLDGFGEQVAEALKLFTTLQGEAVRGQPLRGEALIRGVLRMRDGKVEGAGGAKAILELPERAAVVRKDLRRDLKHSTAIRRP